MEPSSKVLLCTDSLFEVGIIKVLNELTHVKSACLGIPYFQFAIYTNLRRFSSSQSACAFALGFLVIATL